MEARQSIEPTSLTLTGKAIFNCECGRNYYNIKRPGALRLGMEIQVSYCEKCKGTEEVCSDATVCQTCWGGNGRPLLWKREKRFQFCRRYGHWLRLVWRSGRAKQDYTKTYLGMLDKMYGEKENSSSDSDSG